MRLTPSTRRLVGFTLVELLVVIGIIALLISILLPSLNSARNSARKVKCQANLHNVGNALLVYASANRGKLPAAPLPSGVGNPFSGDNWLWDIEIPMRDMIVKSGASRATLYCPAAPENLQNVDYVWTFPSSAATIGGTWSNDALNRWLKGLPSDAHRENGVGILGYICLIRRAQGPGLNAQHAGITYGGTSNGHLQNPGDGRWVPYGRTWKYQTSIVPDNKNCIVKYNATKIGFQKSNSSSETEIFADVVGTDTANPTDYSKLPGGLPGDLYQGSNHLGRNKLPSGANILFLDGHVAWRPFGIGSKYNPVVESFSEAQAIANDYLNQDSVRWRATGQPLGGGPGIHWYW